MGWLVGVDVGGTFTDFFAFDESNGKACLFKRPSTPENPAEAIVMGLSELCHEFAIDAQAVTRLCHGTTVGTNALIQRRGANVVMVTTKGFRDLLEIGRQTRPRMFDLQTDHPPPLVDRKNRLELEERILADGEIETPVSDAEMHRLVQQVLASGAESCAICFLFSFIEPAHEHAFADRLQRQAPDLSISLSSEVHPEFREYERFSTTVLNAYLQPVMGRYLGYLARELAGHMPNAAIGIYQSSGGLMSIERSRRFPVRTALSGPAAGVLGAVQSGRESARANVITLDMGGTSADVCLIQDYHFDVTFNRDVAEFPLRLPMVDVHTVGAGGGSVAWFDRDGLLKVGPESAGADPGPACYGRGGTRPTVTDANLVLGRLSPAGLLSGRMALGLEQARDAFRPMVERLGYSVERIALGVIGIVVANMVRAIRTISVERGRDPRAYSLMSFGGAGPLHATAVARELGIEEILVPAAPGILCAQGLMVSNLKEDFVRSGRMPLDASHEGGVGEAFRDLVERADRWFEAESVAPARRRKSAAVDMRYQGQNFELPVALGSVEDDVPLNMPSADAMRARFFAAHDQQYGYHNPDDPVEIVNFRITATARLTDIEALTPHVTGGGSPEPVEKRSVYFDEEAVLTPVYRRFSLGSGGRLSGPAVIEQLDTTILVPPGDTIQVDDAMNLVIEVAAK